MNANAKKITALMHEIMAIRYTDVAREKELSEELLALAKEENSVYSLAFAYTFLGDALVALKDCKTAVAYLNKAEIMCIKNNFSDLLMRAYNLIGICHESFADEQTAFHNYIRALTLAKKTEDKMYETILLNNIGSNFVSLEDYPTAEKYFNDALSTLKTLSRADDSFNYIKLRIFANCAEMYLNLGKIKKAEKMLALSESIQEDETSNSELLLKIRCLLYAAKDDYVEVEKSADSLFKMMMARSLSDRYLSIESMLTVLDSLIKFKHQKMAKKYLTYLSKTLSKEEIANQSKIQLLNTKYFEAFADTEAKHSAYELFFNNFERNEKNSKHVKAVGLKNIIQLEALAEDLSEKAKDLNEKAERDELTDLYNRRDFNKRFDDIIFDRTNTSVAIVLIDIDYFKDYNDTYGHTKGDMALKAVADILKSVSTDRIFPSRFGGDEFLLLCVNLTNAEIEMTVKLLCDRLEEKNYEHKASMVSDVITLSIGIANVKISSALTPEVLVSMADEKLYQSKHNGRNRYSF